MSIDFVYIKHVVMTIGLNTWGLVLYNNLEVLLLFPLELLIMGELKKIKHDISDEQSENKSQKGDEEQQKLLEIQTISEANAVEDHYTDYIENE
ncbi:GDP-mannose transporter GONST3 [Acorus calamus]|uniref:GDP-mannose transporter GONST3 n=1 Tax=Acorus calamus TaxID=4465 RepID=A0AAV9E6N1_ACOCL|nr:GDP-mannose transporter GONST3 [Acorus calamus]